LLFHCIPFVDCFARTFQAVKVNETAIYKVRGQGDDYTNQHDDKRRKRWISPSSQGISKYQCQINKRIPLHSYHTFKSKSANAVAASSALPSTFLRIMTVAPVNVPTATAAARQSWTNRFSDPFG